MGDLLSPLGGLAGLLGKIWGWAAESPEGFLVFGMLAFLIWRTIVWWFGDPRFRLLRAEGKTPKWLEQRIRWSLYDGSPVADISRTLERLARDSRSAAPFTRHGSWIPVWVVFAGGERLFALGMSRPEGLDERWAADGMGNFRSLAASRVTWELLMEGTVDFDRPFTVRTIGSRHEDGVDQLLYVQSSSRQREDPWAGAVTRVWASTEWRGPLIGGEDEAGS